MALVLIAGCLLMLALMPRHATGLRCYQCYSNSLEPCPFEDLQECPRFSFYNRCSVKVRKMITGEMFVKRECSLGCSDGSDSWDRDLNVSRTIFRCRALSLSLSLACMYSLCQCCRLLC